MNMKRSLTLLFIFLTLATGSFARSFDGAEKLYLNAGAVSWWTNDNAVQRAVLDNGASVIGVWESSVVYAFTIPAGEYTTIRFERASSAEASAWNKTGNIPFDATLNYVYSFAENSVVATWKTYTTPAIQVLSINNSLIDYNDQYAMFNSISETMGKDALWTKHTNLGKTLEYHYNSDPLVPNAKEVVAGTAWSFIILQEQSALPLNNYAQFHTNVETWVTYIRANCPNPDVTIILPVNWPFSTDANYQTSKSTLLANYRLVAEEFGLTLCPVGLAYGNYQVDHPNTFATDLYSDDRHPTIAATYLACCLEYAVMFKEDPSTITYKPASLTAEMAQTLRAYAQEAYEGVERTEPLPTGETSAISIVDDTPYVQNFDTIGGEDVDPSDQEKTAYVRDTQLPEGWRIENNTSSCRTVLSYNSASETTMYIGGQSLASNAKNGTWNFGLTGSTERAVGGITSSVSGGARSINVMAKLHNDAGVEIEALELTYDIEKYRNGENAAGFVIQLYTSTDGQNWTSAGADFCRTYAADANTNGAAVVPILSDTQDETLNCAIPVDGDLYLAWSISPASGTDCAKSMAFGIDNVTIYPSLAQGISDPQTQDKAIKRIRDGQLYIIRGKKKYTVLGTCVE